MTTSIGRESCRGSLIRDGARRSCLSTRYPRPTVEIPAQGPLAGIGSPRVTWVNRGGAYPHWWEFNAAEVQAQADAASVEVADLLCRGCAVKLTRLTEEGIWP